MSQLQFELLSESSKCNITWKIDNFLSVSKNEDFVLDSPSFASGDATWCLRLTVDKSVNEENVNLEIVRLKSHFLQHYVKYYMEVKITDFEDYENYMCEDALVIKENTCTELLKRWFKYSDLEELPEVYLPDGTLTLCLTFEIITNEETIEVSSKKDHFEGSMKVIQDFKRLVLSETDSDVTIRVKGQDFPAHRAIIGVRSPVFGAMLRSEMKEKSSGIVIIEDLDPGIFPDFFCYLYTGDVNELSEKNVFGLYKAADMYDIAELKFKCVRYMESCLSVENFCDIVSICLLHDEKELLKEAVSYFAKHMPEILETVKWQRFLRENSIQGNELLIKVTKQLKELGVFS